MYITLFAVNYQQTAQWLFGQFRNQPPGGVDFKENGMSTVSVHSATMEEASPPTTWITSRPTWIYLGNLLEKLFENYFSAMDISNMEL